MPSSLMASMTAGLMVSAGAEPAERTWTRPRALGRLRGYPRVSVANPW